MNTTRKITPQTAPNPAQRPARGVIHGPQSLQRFGAGSQSPNAATPAPASGGTISNSIRWRMRKTTKRTMASTPAAVGTVRSFNRASMAWPPLGRRLKAGPDRHLTERVVRRMAGEALIGCAAKKRRRTRGGNRLGDDRDSRGGDERQEDRLLGIGGPAARRPAARRPRGMASGTAGSGPSDPPIPASWHRSSRIVGS